MTLIMTDNSSVCFLGHLIYVKTQGFLADSLVGVHINFICNKRIYLF